MQVYLAVRNNNGDTIIVKKRESNAWWEGESRGRCIVNQPGQWALPGGEMKDDDRDEERCAFREFIEETGVDISSYPYNKCVIAQGTSKYVLIELELCNRDDVLAIRDQINVNVAPNAGDDQIPASDQVWDWELQSAILCSRSDVRAHLGVQCDVVLFDSKRAMESKAPRHLIDWYGRMAEYLSNG